MSVVTDAAGKPVLLDHLVEGFIGNTKKKTTGRVYFVSPYGWVGLLSEDGRQWIFHEGKYLIRGEPRPPAQRKDIPERLLR